MLRPTPYQPIDTGEHHGHGQPVRGAPITAVLTALGVLVTVHAAQLGFGFLPGALGELFLKVAVNVVLVGSAVLCLVAGTANSHDRRAWRWLGAGLLSWAVGNVYFAVFLWDLKAPPIPSPADALWLLFYPLMLRGLWLLLRESTARVKTGLVFDGFLAGLVAAAVSAAIVFNAVAASARGPASSVATTLAYPVGDLILLAFVAGALAMTGWKMTSLWGPIAGALGVFLISDGFYLHGVASQTWSTESIVGVGWPLAAFMMAVVAWSGRPLPQSVDAQASYTVVIPVGFGIVGVALLVYGQFQALNALAVGLAATALLAGLGRVLASVRDNRRILDQALKDSLTDGLTSLWNRRKLLDDLAAATNSGRSWLVLFDLDGFKSYNDAFGHPQGDLLLSRLSGRFREAVDGHGAAYRLGGDEFCALLRDTDASQIDDCVAALSESGEGMSVTTSLGLVEVPREASDPGAALSLADRRLYEDKSGGRSSAHQQTRDLALTILAEDHADLRDHASGVADMAQGVGRRLGFDRLTLQILVRAAELHDIGKVAIPDAIIKKPGPLDEEEWELMYRHTIVAERILSAAPALAGLGPAVRSSHERWDGRGYPDGLKGEEIPLTSRIVFVCDAFDGMVSSRPYAPPMPEAQAEEELRRCAGTQFDPKIVAVFLEERAERRGGEGVPRSSTSDGAGVLTS